MAPTRTLSLGSPRAATSRSLFTGFTIQPLRDGPLRAYPAAAAPEGLLHALSAFSPVAEAPAGDPPDGGKDEDALPANQDLGLELDVDEDDEYLLKWSPPPPPPSPLPPPDGAALAAGAARGRGPPPWARIPGAERGPRATPPPSARGPKPWRATPSPHPGADKPHCTPYPSPPHSDRSPHVGHRLTP